MGKPEYSISNKSILNKKFRIKNSIAMVYNKETKILNLFKTNTRESIYLRIDYDIIDLLQQFDGKINLSNIISKNVFQEKEIIQLVIYLNKNKILIEHDVNYELDIFEANYRIINFLEYFCCKTSEVVQSLEKLNKSTVLIFGLGGVGSWIVDTLARSGVKNFILVDDDIVEQTNLHRQNLFFPDQIGKFKVDCIEEGLKLINPDINIKKYIKKLDSFFFNSFMDDFDLAINCADFPNVDTTTRIIGSECMTRNKPHIIGGGYNLHLTLIGQTVIPFKSACYECFSMKLQEINNDDVKDLKKLYRPTRKIGSFTPLCTIAASLASLEAVKIICGFFDDLVNTSKRIEFSIETMDFKIMDIERNPNCKICGCK